VDVLKKQPLVGTARNAFLGKGGNEIMSASWASHLYTREICGCVENAALGGHSTQRLFTSYWESAATQPIIDAAHIKN
jgi:hypothetical protein